MSFLSDVVAKVTSETPKKQLRHQYCRLQSDFQRWRCIAARIRQPIDQLRVSYEQHDYTANCCLICRPHLTLSPLIENTIDEFRKAEREVSDCRLAAVEPSGSDDHVATEDDDDDSNYPVRPPLQQLAETCAVIVEKSSAKGMSRAELEEQIPRLESVLRKLRADYEADCTRLRELDTRYQEARGRCMTSCRRYEVYSDVIELAVHDDDDDDDGLEAAARDARMRARNDRQARRAAVAQKYNYRI